MRTTGINGSVRRFVREGGFGNDGATATVARTAKLDDLENRSTELACQAGGQDEVFARTDLIDAGGAGK